MGEGKHRDLHEPSVLLMLWPRHTPFKGANNIDGGILINLERLPSPGISPDHKTITISPSQTWDMVYEELDAYNLSTLGAKVAGVGVGMLSLSPCSAGASYPGCGLAIWQEQFYGSIR